MHHRLGHSPHRPGSVTAATYLTREYIRIDGQMLAIENISSIANAALNIVSTHSGYFVQGTSAHYSLTVNNAASAGPTGDGSVVTVTETLPTGLSLASMSGPGWVCPTGGNTCTRSDSLPANSAYPPISVVVNVLPNSASPLINQATVSSGGSPQRTANDSTTIVPPFTISVTPSGSFTQGAQGQYTVAVANGPAGVLGGVVTVSVAMSPYMPIVPSSGLSGSGWSCNTSSLLCTISSAGSYSPISVLVNVASNATPSVQNTFYVSGSASTATVAETVTTAVVQAGSLSISQTANAAFTQGQYASYSITLSNGPQAGSTSGTVTLTETPPSGITVQSIALQSGTGSAYWSCSGSSCQTSQSIVPGAQYVFTVSVFVSAGAASGVSNQVSVSGGGTSTVTNLYTTTIIYQIVGKRLLAVPLKPACKLHSRTRKPINNGRRAVIPICKRGIFHLSTFQLARIRPQPI